ncbi:hypothetical protein WG922_19735 [Ramlibacter sp. AN1015]|uniref:hypothetical protein n=1 Tax=Ramlibacter sp. AN1015 TaxID=3133428 RepID=UPI0030BC68EE
MRRNHFWRLVPGAALILLTAGSSMALTLGRSQGVAMLGRPLDVTVPVVLDAPGAIADLCARAEVFYGETRVEVRSLDPRATGGTNAVLRVQVPKPIDEAFVTVQLQVGCTQTFTRKFVLLTEAPGDVAEAAAQSTPVAPLVLPASTSLPLTQAPAVAAPEAPTAAAPSAPTASAPVGASLRPRAAPATPPAARATPAAPRPTPAVRAAAEVRPPASSSSTRPVAPAPKPAPKQPVVERPRLKLDAAEVRTGPAAAAAPAAKPAAGVPQAAATQAPAAASSAPAAPGAGVAPGAAQADDLLQSAQRMLTLEADMKAMREGMAKNEALMRELRSRLDEAESERYANGLVYALAALLAASGALAGLFWHRSRKATLAQASWWGDRATEGEPELHEEADPPASAIADVVPAAAPVVAAMPASAVVDSRPAPLTSFATTAAAPASPREEPNTAASDVQHIDLPLVDVPLVDLEPTVRSGVRATASVHDDAGTDDLQLTDVGVSLEALSDLQQEADFFSSLGEYDRAIEVLRAHIDAQPQGSAVAWLELLDLYHRLGREHDYEQLRRDFEWMFNAQAPSYHGYPEEQAGLAAYPAKLAQVQALWGTPGVLDIIGDAVTRPTFNDSGEVVGVETLRDLLMLHGVASDLLGAQRDARPSLADLPEAAAVGSAAGASVSEFAPLSLDALQVEPHPSDEWKKLAPSNSRPAGLDVNLDDAADAPSASSPSTTGSPARGTGAGELGNLLDFDLDPNTAFKLPKR